MTRGRHPLEAIRAAEKIALKRGLVQYLEPGADRLCDFEIVSPPILAPVRVKRMGTIRSTAKSLEREAAEEIADLKMYPSSPEISRELWICSTKYFLRFFQVTDTGLVELGPDGQPLPSGSPPTGTSRRRRVPHLVQVSGSPAPTITPSPVPLASVEAPVVPDSAHYPSPVSSATPPALITLTARSTLPRGW